MLIRCCLACSKARLKCGADDRNRTGDLVLTKDALCQLSYIGSIYPFVHSVERETGIEPATNSLEGCDSTTELLPLTSTSRGCSVPIVLATVLLVAREGFEPSKPLGRQIYSLLRLTASLPRQIFVLLPSNCLSPKNFSQTSWPAIWSWRRDLNPRPSDYKSDALPG